VDLIMGTFSKACGSFGAYIACSKKLRDYFINFCQGFIYSTALPPSVVGAIDAAVDLIPEMDEERQALQQKAKNLRMTLSGLGYDTGTSSTQIVPVIIGDEAETLALSRWLEKNGILATALRPPTVAPGKSRIRLALSLHHTDEHMGALAEAFRAWKQSPRLNFQYG
jgi:8-amino-7-oxononanoate synthase